MTDNDIEITPQLLLNAYCNGAFPMGESRDDTGLIWLCPDPRGVFPLNGLIVSKSLRKIIRKKNFSISVNKAFLDVMKACAAPQPNRTDREDTWITPQILDLYCSLHEMGNAHSIECWIDGDLVGGLYGVHFGGAFFGESMFSFTSNASKVALVHLVSRLRAGGFFLLDTQFITPHLESLGAIEIPRHTYFIHLEKALRMAGNFFPDETLIADELSEICLNRRKTIRNPSPK